ncbi:hypothetical protein F503_02522 [Ophiostoma piceae UAMH 11346]|uniref:DUF7924 domain-containing protein n=1 Tax=Ophiostoma piceae (strain UAMH 11346) TaxID=1262450 RepID=S3BYQ7_OPHP1|nr:hypothetical protein F503_02522 [Ophiostoma piceae UAMH 11346]
MVMMPARLCAVSRIYKLICLDLGQFVALSITLSIQLLESNCSHSSQNQTALTASKIIMFSRRLPSRTPVGGGSSNIYIDPNVLPSDSASNAGTVNAVQANRNAIANAQLRRLGDPPTGRRLLASNTTPPQRAAGRPSTVVVRPINKPLPENVAAHLATIRRGPRQSPQASSDGTNGNINDALSAYNRLSRGCSQADLAAFFREHIFSSQSPARAAPIRNSWSMPLAPHLTAACSVNGRPVVTIPSPQLLCGYSSNPADGAFSHQHVAAQERLQPNIPHYTWANRQGLSFPFLAAEFAASGLSKSSDNSTDESVSQCAVACTASVKIARRLNRVAKWYQEERQRKGKGQNKFGALSYVPEICHGVVVDQNTADLYVAWAEESSTEVRAGELVYFVQRTEHYMLSKPEHMEEFRRQVHNIAAWGIQERLSMVRAALYGIGLSVLSS